jgi:hypothetical protein
VDDRTSPVAAYETFRGALARAEYDRAYATLSDPLRKKLGVRSRAEFKDGMIVLGDDIAAKALARSKAKGPAQGLPDGRAMLPVRLRYLLFGRDVRLWLRPVAVVRVFVDGQKEPVFYDHLAAFELREEGGVVGVRLDPRLRAALEAEVRTGRVRRFEAGIEWFLDDFEVGDEGERKE